MRRAPPIRKLGIIERGIPALSLYALGLGSLAAGLTQVAAALDVYYGYRLEVGLALLSLMAMNVVLAALAAAKASRRRGYCPPSAAFRFVHLAVAVHAAIALPSLLPALRTLLDGYILPFMFWTSISGAALALAMLNGTRRDARFAALGAVVSLAVFGCAVRYAPDIYGWDLRPLGWYAILASSIPVLAFLAVFLRRAPIFSESRLRRRALTAALFAALACATVLHMAANPADRFSANLRAALDGGASEVDFSDLTDFEWDTVEIYVPYTFVDSLSPSARESADAVSMSRLEFNRSIDFVVFLKDEEVVHFEIARRDNHEFAYFPDRPRPWALRREDAVFTVSRGESRHALTPRR